MQCHSILDYVSLNTYAIALCQTACVAQDCWEIEALQHYVLVSIVFFFWVIVSHCYISKVQMCSSLLIALATLCGLLSI